jgi:hypothetical protein
MQITDVSNVKDAFERVVAATSKENQPWYKTELQPAYRAFDALLEDVSSASIKVRIDALTHAQQILGGLEEHLAKPPHPSVHDQSLVKQSLSKVFYSLTHYLKVRTAELAEYRTNANAKLKAILDAGALMKDKPSQNNLNEVVRLIGEYANLAKKIDGLQLGQQAQECLRNIKLCCEKLWKAQQDAQHKEDHPNQSVTAPLCDEFKKRLVAFRDAKA